jgi:hypothetical protein
MSLDDRPSARSIMIIARRREDDGIMPGDEKMRITACRRKGRCNGARLSRTLEHERYVEDGGSAKDGTGALAKGVATNEVSAMAQPNKSATNRREGLAMGQPEKRRRDVAMAQP